MTGEIQKKYVETPLMKQYYDIKSVHHDAILLFRVGDFYETFGDDAVRTSKILEITLTKRANGAASSVELAGFPHHALDNYLTKLVRAGERVAICEQLEDPKTAKTIVRRGVTELVTPGIMFNDNILRYNENTFVACVYFGKEATGAAFLDATTGEFFTAQGNNEYIDKLLNNFQPKEVLLQRGLKDTFESAFGTGYYTYQLEEWIFSEHRSAEKLKAQFEVASLKGFGIEDLTYGQTAAGAILYYLEFTEHKNTKHISSITRMEEDSYVWLDKYSMRNLEIFRSNSPGGLSFIDVIDKTVSPMGSRLLKRWVSFPLKDVRRIEQRLDVVDYLIATKHDLTEKLSEKVKMVGDLERLASKIALSRINPREMLQLKHAFDALAVIKESCLQSAQPQLKSWGEAIDACEDMRERIESHILPETSNQIQKGGVIADGVDATLDDLRRIAIHGKDYLQEIQQRESDRTGISSLKISYNNVFGYYIEVRNTHKDKVPQEWIRKQTLVGAERYITEELKEYEQKILGAEEKILAIEQQIYAALILDLNNYLATIQKNASIIARIDCLMSFAVLGTDSRYCRPELFDSGTLDIKGGRHPVIESLLPIGEEYIPNDVFLDGESQQIIIITGPNMSGKSALLRQTALIVLLAQIGCYIPAKEAAIGIVDRIFTRVGASDNISQGESTFMVEMLESANILNNLTDRSLVLLDEIGRGTSTYDGISIAWAMVEYIHQMFKARTMFATHYHELNEMEEIHPRIKNYNVSVRETGNKVIFLRKLVPGGTQHSFGIHVARMAGMPQSIVKRAGEILKSLEKLHGDNEKQTVTPGKTKASDTAGMQLSFFQLDDPVLKQIRDEIKDLDVNNLTPLEALNKLNDIKRITGL